MSEIIISVKEGQSIPDRYEVVRVLLTERHANNDGGSGSHRVFVLLVRAREDA